jgi:hypothetical protein
MSDEPRELPWRCPEHPDAQILHSWDHKHAVLNGEPAGLGWYAGGDKFQCAVCRRELKPDPKIRGGHSERSQTDER